MRIAKLVLAIVIFAAPGTAFADMHEFFGCKFNEGHGMSDLDKWLPKWKAVIDGMKFKEQFDVWVLTPQYDTANTQDFFFMGSVTDANALGSGLSEYFEAGKGTAVEADLNKFAKCTGSLWWGRKVYGK